MDDNSAGRGKGQLQVTPDQIRVMCSKSLLKTSHSHELKHEDLSGFFYAKKDFILQQARNGGMTILLDSDYSIDVAARESSSYPMYQLYNHSGISMGIYSYTGRYYFIEIIESNLAHSKFTEW